MIKLCDYLEKCELRKSIIDKMGSPYCYGSYITSCKQYKRFKENYDGEPLGIGGCDEETYKRLNIEYVSGEEQLRRLREIK